MKYFLIRGREDSQKLIIDVSQFNDQELATLKMLLVSHHYNRYDLISIINDMDWVKKEKSNIVPLYKIFPISSYIYECTMVMQDRIKLGDSTFDVKGLFALSNDKLEVLTKIWQEYRTVLAKTKSANVKSAMIKNIQYLDMLENEELKTLIIVKSIIT